MAALSTGSIQPTDAMIRSHFIRSDYMKIRREMNTEERHYMTIYLCSRKKMKKMGDVVL